MPPTPVCEANRFRRRVDLDENLVLTSASVRKGGRWFRLKLSIFSHPRMGIDDESNQVT